MSTRVFASGFEALGTAESLWGPIGGQVIMANNSGFDTFWRTNAGDSNRIKALLVRYEAEVHRLAKDRSKRPTLPQVYPSVGAVSLSLFVNGCQVTFSVELRQSALIITYRGDTSALPDYLRPFLRYHE